MSRRSPSYVLYLASGIAGRAGMLAVLVVITRFLGTAEYGFFALVVATGEMLDMIANNWIRIHVLREQAGRPLIGSVRMGRTLALYGAMTFAAAMAALIVAYLVDAPDTAALRLQVSPTLPPLPCCGCARRLCSNSRTISALPLSRYRARCWRAGRPWSSPH
ncbi:MAG: hypothetical protein R3D43_04465 [Tepidamorphaceae bacterium]